MNNGYDLEDDIEVEKITDFFDCYDEYIVKELIPKAAAYYIATAYNKEFLSPYPIKNHINSALDIFNIECDYENIIAKVEKILKDEYNLKIEDVNVSKIVRIKE